MSAITKAKDYKPGKDGIGLIRESGKDLIDLEERSIRERVRIWKPVDAGTFADDLIKRKCYGTKYKRMVQVIQSEMDRMNGGVSA